MHTAEKIIKEYGVNETTYEAVRMVGEQIVPYLKRASEMSPVEFYTKVERKENGVFYTPSFLAEYLAKKVVKYFGNRKIATAIDPACGDSILLRSFANELLNNQTKNLPKIFELIKTSMQL
ncbi:MAG: hypothetical protein IPJ66_09140 [Bacteroidetes bacterium]|nr:hypothetical protein [Bacteroidota bacterium]